MTTSFNLSDPGDITNYFGSVSRRIGNNSRDVLPDDESLSVDEKDELHRAELARIALSGRAPRLTVDGHLVRRAKRKRPRESAPDEATSVAEDATELASEAESENEFGEPGIEERIADRLREAEWQRLFKQHRERRANGAPVPTLDEATRTLCEKKSGSGDQKLYGEIRQMLINKICKPEREAELDELLRAKFGEERSFAALSASLDAPVRKNLADKATDELVYEQIIEKLEKKVSDELRERRMKFPESAVALGDIDRLYKVRGEEALAKRFKRFLGVEPGSVILELEREVRKKKPNATQRQVSDEARVELKKLLRNFRLAWQRSLPDAKILELLQRDKSDEAKTILRLYQNRQARYESTDAESLALRHSDIAIKDRAHADQARRREEYIKGRSRLVNGEEDQRLVALESLREPEMQVATIEPSVDGQALVERNAMRQIIEPGVHDMANFVSAYASNKSRSSELHRGDLAEQLQRQIVDALNMHVKMLSIAPPDAQFTRDGERSCGNATEDLCRLLKRALPGEEISYEALVAYRRFWDENRPETPIDVNRALATSYHAYDENRIIEVMRKFGVPEDRVRADLAYGSRPDNNEVLRIVMQAIDNDLFKRTQSQAMDDTDLDRRVNRARARAMGTSKKSRMPKTTTLVLKTLGETPLDPVANPAIAIDMEECQRSYLQRFMREPLGPEYGELECANGNNCVCNVLAANYPEMCSSQRKGSGFICMQFLLPSELEAYRATGKLPASRKLCVLCMRAVVTFAYLDSIRNGTEPRLPLHDWCVKIDQEGEYDASAILEMTQGQGKLCGIVAPFVKFNACDYVYRQVKAGNRSVRGMLETNSLDFRLSSDLDPRI